MTYIDHCTVAEKGQAEAVSPQQNPIGTQEKPIGTQQKPIGKNFDQIDREVEMKVGLY